jgi:hypothetical protein
MESRSESVLNMATTVVETDTELLVGAEVRPVLIDGHLSLNRGSCG